MQSEVQIDLRFECKECGKPVEADVGTGSRYLFAIVAPCENCTTIADRIEEAYREGYEDGKFHQKKEGE